MTGRRRHGVRAAGLVGLAIVALAAAAHLREPGLGLASACLAMGSLDEFVRARRLL